MGRYIEIRNKRGKVIATFTPYLGGHFWFSPDFASRHSLRWRQAFERDFRANLHTYLNNGGFLNEQSSLNPDGNEDFRRRWSKRIDENGYGEFADYYMHPEDYDTPEAGKLSVSYQNADGVEVSKELSVVPGEFGDNMPEHKRYFGVYFDIKDEYGSVIARYAPRTGKVKYTTHKDAQYMRQAVTEQLRRKAKSLVRNAGLLDADGKLITDLNEEYRTARQAANDVPNLIPTTQQNVQAMQNSNPETQQGAQEQGIQGGNQATQQATQGITPFG